MGTLLHLRYSFCKIDASTLIMQGWYKEEKKNQCKKLSTLDAQLVVVFQIILTIMHPYLLSFLNHPKALI